MFSKDVLIFSHRIQISHLAASIRGVMIKELKAMRFISSVSIFPILCNQNYRSALGTFLLHSLSSYWAIFRNKPWQRYQNVSLNKHLLNRNDKTKEGKDDPVNKFGESDRTQDKRHRSQYKTFAYLQKIWDKRMDIAYVSCWKKRIERTEASPNDTNNPQRK